MDANNGDGIANACEGRTGPVPASRRRLPHGGRQMSLHCRHYPDTGILTKGGKSRVHTVERIETGSREFTQLRNTLHDGRAYCCFVWDYLGELARDYNDCGSVSLNLSPWTPWVSVYIIPDP